RQNSLPSPQPASLEDKREALSNWWKTGPLGNSETLRELGRKLSQPIFSSGERGANADGLLEKLSRLGNNVHLKDLFSRRMPSGPANALRQKSLDVSHLGVSRAESPGGSGAKILFWAAMGVFVIILMWQIAAGRRAAGAGAGQPAWHLGPWPVDPSQVA